MQDIRLAALLASRLCHDLTGPVGAIGNGVELLIDETDEGVRRQSFELVEMSATEANRRLAFYRLTLGAAGGLQASIPVSEARRVALDFFEGRKADLEWAETLGAGIQLPPAGTRLLLNLVLLVVESMPRGGRVGVSIEGEGPWTLSVRGEGTGAAVRDEDRAALSGSLTDEALDARTAQPAYAAALAASAGSTINLDSSQDKLTLSVELTPED